MEVRLHREFPFLTPRLRSFLAVASFLKFDYEVLEEIGWIILWIRKLTIHSEFK